MTNGLAINPDCPSTKRSGFVYYIKEKIKFLPKTALKRLTKTVKKNYTQSVREIKRDFL